MESLDKMRQEGIVFSIPAPKGVHMLDMPFFEAIDCHDSVMSYNAIRQ